MSPKKIIIAICFTFCFCSIYSQTSPKDSLNSLLTNSKNDREKIELLQLLLNEYQVLESDLTQYTSLLNSITVQEHRKDFLDIFFEILENYRILGIEKQCLRSYGEIQKIAKEYASTNYLVKSNISLARFYFDKGDFDTSENYMNKASQLYKSNDTPWTRNPFYVEKSRQQRIKGQLDSSLYSIDYAIKGLDEELHFEELSSANNGKGRVLRQLGKMDSSEYYYNRSLVLAEKHHLVSNLSASYNNLGNIGHIKGDYDQAIAYYLKSIEIKEKKANKKGLSIGYHNIGAIKVDMKDYEGAIKEFNKSNELAYPIEYKTIIIHNALKKGEAYRLMGENENGIANFEEALNLSEEIGFKKGEIGAYLGLGTINRIQQNYNIAFTNLSKALSESEKLGNKSYETSSLIEIAQWYNEVNEKSTDGSKVAFSEIESLLLRAKDMSEEMDYGEKRLSVYDGLNKLYRQSENYKKHSDLMTEYIAYKDTLFSKTRTQAITDYETKYATAEKEKEIIQLQGEKKISELKTRAWKIALGIITFFLGILGLFLYKYQQRKNQQKQLEEAEKFRTKISSDLHDDVGTMLSSLAMQSEVMGLTAKEDQVEKFEKLSNLSREAMSRMRDTVWAIDSRKDGISDLLDRMKDYLADRLDGHKLQVEFIHKEVELESKLRPDIRQNIYLIFKEAVHNAAKYSNGDKLKIVLRQNEKEIFLEVKDNGKVDPDKIQTSGLGITNMELRAERIGRQLEINTDNGFAVIV